MSSRDQSKSCDLSRFSLSKSRYCVCIYTVYIFIVLDSLKVSVAQIIHLDQT